MSDHGVGTLAPGVDFRGHQSGTGAMNTQTPAQQDYAARQVRIRALLATATSALDAHAAKAAGQPNNWAFGGDLGAAEDRLLELLECLGS